MAREAIFIGYRRDDTADVAGRIFDALESRFGRDRIFKDVDNLRPGAGFGEFAVRYCCSSAVRNRLSGSSIGQARLDHLFLPNGLFGAG